MASTGSNLDAEMAGNIPEINPINAANPVPKRTFPRLRTKSNSKTLVKIIEIIQTKNSPINPPITDKITASNRNWNNINRFWHPMIFEFQLNSFALLQKQT